MRRKRGMPRHGAAGVADRGRGVCGLTALESPLPTYCTHRACLLVVQCGWACGSTRSTTYSKRRGKDTRRVERRGGGWWELVHVRILHHRQANGRNNEEKTANGSQSLVRGHGIMRTLGCDTPLISSSQAATSLLATISFGCLATPGFYSH